MSLVTKIGRQVSKNGVTLYNVHKSRVLDIPTFRSIAWSFKDDGPVEETLHTRVHLSQNSGGSNTLSDKKKRRIADIYATDWEKYSGVSGQGMTLNTNKLLDNKIQKSLLRLRQERISNLPPNVTGKIINTVLIPVAEFAILESKTNLDLLDMVDKKIISTCKANYNLGINDAKHMIFIPEKSLGMGLRSFTGQCIAETGRELEVRLNNNTLVSQ